MVIFASIKTCLCCAIYTRKNLKSGNNVPFNTDNCEQINITVVSLLYTVPLQFDTFLYHCTGFVIHKETVSI